MCLGFYWQCSEGRRPESGPPDDLRSHGVCGEIGLYGSVHVCMANN